MAYYSYKLQLIAKKKKNPWLRLREGWDQGGNMKHFLLKNIKLVIIPIKKKAEMGGGAELALYFVIFSSHSPWGAKL